MPLLKLTLLTLRSKFEFSFVAPIHFLQKWWGEVDNISSEFILCDHVLNSHDHSVLQSIDITRRNLMLITPKVMLHGTICNDDFSVTQRYNIVVTLV